MNITKKQIEEVDEFLSGGLTLWVARNKNFLTSDPWSVKALNIAAWQLYESHKSGNQDAISFLNRVIACKTAKPCFQILCPMCRVAKQDKVSQKVQSAFGHFAADEIGFATMLLPIEKTASGYIQSIQSFRIAMKYQLRRRHMELSGVSPFKMCGAFEVDLKNLATHFDLSLRSRELMKGLGFDHKSVKPQYLPHLHAIIAPLDSKSRTAWTQCVESALGTKLLPDQMLIRALHKNRPMLDNLDRMSRYMYKARLQYSENVLTDNPFGKSVRYTRPYKGKSLVDYLLFIDCIQNFKGLKCEYNM